MLACVLAFALVPAVPSTARAVGVAEAQAALDEAEARMQSIASEHDALQKEVDDLQARIDKTAAQVLESNKESSKARLRSARRPCTSIAAARWNLY